MQERARVLNFATSLVVCPPRARSTFFRTEYSAAATAKKDGQQLGITVTAHFTGVLSPESQPDKLSIDRDHLLTGEVSAIRVTAGPGVLARFGYDQLGRRLSLFRGNATATLYRWDAADRRRGIDLDPRGTAQDQVVDFTHGAAGQVRSRAASNDRRALTLG